MKRVLAFILVSLLILSGFSAVVAAETVSSGKTVLYVATDGKDTNTGTIDSPFASLEKARDTIRSMKKGGKLGEDGALVYVRGGEYLIKKSLELTKEDSGSQKAPVVYRNYPGEKVTFIGGAQISWDKFKKVSNASVIERIADKNARSKIYEVNLFELGYTDIPELSWPGTYSYAAGMQEVHKKLTPKAIAPELIVDGKAMTIARYPNDSQMSITRVIEPGASPRMWEDDKKGSDSYVPEGEREPTPFTIHIDDERLGFWENAKDALITGTFFHSWADQTIPVKSVDGKKKEITSLYPSHYSVAQGQHFHIYNLLEEIDMPGEYFVDRESGMLYFYPTEGKIETVIYTSLDEYMFSLSDAEYVEIKGIDMSYMRNGAVKLENCRNCKVTDCTVNYTGKRAMTVSGSDNEVKDCYLYDVEGGIALSGGDRNTLTPANNVVENCEFENCDRISKTYNPAINLSGVGNKALYNKIHGAQHTVMLFSGNDQLIAYNEIYDACQNSDDMSAIYAGRDLSSRGHKIMYNYIHDIGGEEDRGVNGVHGIFLDDFFSWAHITGNVFADITGAGVMLAGSHNVMHNNIFVNVQKTAGLFTRSYNYGAADNSGEITFKQRLDEVPYLGEIWTTRYPEIKNVIDANGKFDINNNIVATNNVLVNSEAIKTSPEIAATATVKNNVSYYTDPGFYDMKNENYLLKLDSKVFTDIEGFKIIPFTRIGKYSDRAVNRIKNAYAYCKDSSYAYKKGDLVQEQMTCLIQKDGIKYMPLRLSAEAVEAALLFDEKTEEISLATGAKTLSFRDGATDKVFVNGTEYELKNPIINMDYVNYISVADIVDIFEKKLVEKENLVIISDIDALFTPQEDDVLLRYIEQQLTVY